MRAARTLRALAVTCLLGTHAALLAWGAWRHSPAIDEVGHLPAGLSHWQLGMFELYHVNPPLVRMVAAIPLALRAPRVDWTWLQAVPGMRGEWGAGEVLLATAKGESFWLFTVARWWCIPFSLLGGYICYRWAAELYGQAAGVTALALWSFDPNILAHGQMITPDVGATALGLLASYAFWRWLRRPTWELAVLAGFALGMAELTKTTWLLLYAVLPVAWAAWRLLERSVHAERRIRREACQLVLVIGFSVYLINLGYRFEGSFQRLDTFRFISEALTGQQSHVSAIPGNRFAGTPLGGLRIPLPEHFVLGIDHQRWDFERKFPSYLRGEWKVGGWWYYYLYGLAVKEPLGTWALVGLAALYRRRTRSAPARDELLLWLPAATVLTLVSSQTGFNHHLRYVLPTLPFVFIWVSQVALTFRRDRWALATLAGIAMGWSVASSLWVYPHSMAYFNELAGGPSNGHAHMLDSNFAWGQDLLYLKRWADAHPEATPLHVICYGLVDPKLAGIESAGWPPSGPPPSGVPAGASHDEFGPKPGWYAVDASGLHADDHPARPSKEGRAVPYCGYFSHFSPVAQAGYTIYIYHITEPDANRVREELGLLQWSRSITGDSGGTAEPRSQ